MNRYRRYFLAALSGLALAACGGGGNGPSGNADDLVDMALGQMMRLLFWLSTLLRHAVSVQPIMTRCTKRSSS